MLLAYFALGTLKRLSFQIWTQVTTQAVQSPTRKDVAKSFVFYPRTGDTPSHDTNCSNWPSGGCFCKQRTAENRGTTEGKTDSSLKVTRPEGGVWRGRKTSGVLLCVRIKGVQTSFSAFCLGCGVGMGSWGGGYHQDTLILVWNCWRINTR